MIERIHTKLTSVKPAFAMWSTLEKLRRVPVRHRVMFMCLLASVICYAARFVLSVAIIAIAREYKYSKAEQGWCLSAFFYGYVTTGYFGGWLATKYGGYHVLNAAVGLWSFFTYFTPAATRISLHALLICRVLIGVVQVDHSL